ncbi:ribonuclease III [Alphaproteobacteria bacterium LSUCC0684]
MTDQGSSSVDRAAPDQLAPDQLALDLLMERLGYRFGNRALLIEALTHPSYTDGSGRIPNNQRLEFLGDRVIGLVIADALFTAMAAEREGQLTRRYADCVENSRLARIARDLEIGRFLKVQPNTNLAETDKVLADALEAVIGAIWRDGGMEAASGVIASIWGDMITGEATVAKDNKTRLQEYALDRKMGLPKYAIIDRTGPDHEPIFTVSVTLGEASLTATGMSKRSAEQQAAALMLEKIR